MIIRSIVLKLASLCNLNCSYCYVYNHMDKSYLSKPKFIDHKTYENLIISTCQYYDKLKLQEFNISFHGGEPTLMDISEFRKLMKLGLALIGDRNFSFSIQTNGTLLNDEWAKLFAQYQISVGVSLDGFSSVNDSARVYHSGKGSYMDALRGVLLLRKYGVEPYILCVINPEFNGFGVYQHFLELGIKNIDFLLPDATHDTKNQYIKSSSKTPISDFLIPVFDEWIKNDDPQVKIRIFMEIIKRLLGRHGETDLFGGPQFMNYIVVETNGDVEILDALRVCGDGMPKLECNINHDTLFDISSRFTVGETGILKVLKEIVPSKDCISCKFSVECAGGYLPHRYSDQNQFNNPSLWCLDLYRLFDHISISLKID